MSRIGEVLVAARQLVPAQVEQALRAQVMWGARLGTNLVELGLVDLDTLTRALGEQRTLPAALSHHFDRADPELQARLTPELAERWRVVPLVRVGPARRIAVACMDPLDAATRRAMAAALRISPAELVIAIAAEQRLHYQLERVYGIPRNLRFMRARGGTEFPELGELPSTTESDADIPITLEEEDDDAQTIIRVSAEAIPELLGDVDQTDKTMVGDLTAQIEAAVEAANAPPDDRDPTERRVYLKTIADEPPQVEPQALGRIAIRRRRARTSHRPASLDDAVRAIRRAADRDRVAELVVDTLERFAPVCEAALLMVVRGGVALGWKWLCRAGQPQPDLAVPLDQAGLLPQVLATKRMVRGRVGELSAIDERLLHAIGPAGGDLVVLPIAIADRVMCVIATVTAPGTTVEVVEAVAAAAGKAFARLVRAASR